MRSSAVRLAVPTVLALVAACFAPSALARQQGGSGNADPDSMGVTSKATEAETTLEQKEPEPGTRGPLSGRATVAALSATPPSEGVHPPPAPTNDPLYGKIQIGKTGMLDFALARSSADSPHYDLLFFDRNLNHLFEDDGAPLKGVSTHDATRDLDYTEFTMAPVSLHYGGTMNALFPFTFYVWYPRTGPLTEALYVSAAWRQGEITLEGVPCRIALYDADNNGLYDTESCTWCLEPAGPLDGAASWSGKKFFPATTPFRVKDVPYIVSSVTGDGGRVQLTSMTGDEAFTAEMDSDPLLAEPARPQATEPIAWVSSVKDAFDQALRERKRVLLLADVTWNKSARDFRDRTLKDGEVVTRSKDYVCVKVDLDAAPDVRERFEIDGSPTILFLEADGTIRERVVGYRAARAFCESLVRNH